MINDSTETDYVVLKRAKIADKHKPTGKTVHYFGDDILPSPFELQIAQYPGDDGYYLFYLDDKGKVMTDTYHDDLQRAMEQAQWEFEIVPSEWETPG